MKIHMTSILIFSILALQGCVGALIVSTAAVATKTATDPRTIGTQIDNSILSARISKLLAKNQDLNKYARIINIVYNNKILLLGQAPTIELAIKAKQIVMNINSTIQPKIYNEIRQGYPISIIRILMDVWITTKIYSQLIISNIISISNIKVITENGEVFLLGLVTNNEGKHAAKLASKVNGVKHVITVFTYLY